MQCEILKTFKYADPKADKGEGEAIAGTTCDLPLSVKVIASLAAENYLRLAEKKDAGPAPQNKMLGRPPKNKGKK